MRRAPPRRTSPRRVARSNEIAPVSVADVADRDADGDLWVRLTRAPQGAPLIRLAPLRGESVAGAPGLGDRLLVRIQIAENGDREARLLKRLGQSAHQVLGVVRRSRRELRVEPVDRRARSSLVVADIGGLADGDLVLVQVDPDGGRPHGSRRARLVSRFGREDDTRAASLIAAHVNGVVMGFSPDALQEADAARAPDSKGRTDLRAIPFITIDPPDARDHDDAVFAESDADPRNRGGWVVRVAIADVAAFVRPGSALDRDAREKGNIGSTRSGK